MVSKGDERPVMETEKETAVELTDTNVTVAKGTLTPRDGGSKTRDEDATA
jgi:hypothetical protein